MDADDRDRRRPATAVRSGFAVLTALFALVVGVAAVGFAAFGPHIRTVAPAIGPVGASSEGFAVWDRNDDGRPVRWDGCSPIEIVMALDDAPAGARDDVAEAVRTLREATGLDLVVSGTTDETPSGAREPFQPGRYGARWAPVLIAWAPPHDRGLPMRDVDRGVGMPVALGAPGHRTYVTGQVVLNADRVDLRTGSSDRGNSWGATILHELAHVLGLAHVDDPAELMYVHPGDGPVELGAGDRSGLRAVGADGTCLDVPHPQPVDVG